GGERHQQAPAGGQVERLAVEQEAREPQGDEEDVEAHARAREARGERRQRGDERDDGREEADREPEATAAVQEQRAADQRREQQVRRQAGQRRLPEQQHVEQRDGHHHRQQRPEEALYDLAVPLLNALVDLSRHP